MHDFEPDGLLLAATGMPPLLFIALCGLAAGLYLACLLSESRRHARQLRERLQAAHDSEEDLSGRLHALLHCAPDAVLTISTDGFIESFNSAAERMFGWSAKEIANRHFRELFPDADDGDCYIHDFVKGSAGELVGSIREVRALRRDGTSFVAECSAADQGRSGRRGVLAIVRDVSEIRRHEHLLAQSELRLREAQQLARLGNMELALGEGRMFWSEELFHLFGLDPQGSQPDMRLFLSLVHPEDRDGVELAMDTLIRQGSCHEQSYRLLPQAGLQDWHFIRLIVDRDDSGRPLRLLATVQDISEQHRLEETRRRMDEKLHQIHKLETIGSVSSAIAHDFNNILTPIIGFTDLSLAETGRESTVHRHLQQVRRGAGRARELVRRILSFSDNPRMALLPVSLHAAAEEVLSLLSVRAGKRIKLQLTPAPVPLYVMADATQLHQVLLNLCTNALQAIGTEQGQIELRLERLNVDLGTLEKLPALKLGPHAVISVIDDGIGIRDQERERIFEPFFSTRPADGGSGIGLSVVHGIVLSHRGEIQVESCPGKGSCFRVYLPLVDSLSPQQAHSEPEASSLMAEAGTEHVLLVDDEPDINKLVLEQLERLGYRVTACRAASQVLDLLREQPDSFDILITDFTMPRMDGEKLVRRLREMQIKLPVIMITGFSEGLPQDIMEELGIALLVHKPLMHNELARAIRRILGPVETQLANDKNPVG